MRNEPDSGRLRPATEQEEAQRDTGRRLDSALARVAGLIDVQRTAGEVSSEERQAIFREPYSPKQNRAILATSKSLLGGGLLSQRHFLLMKAVTPMPCPSCGRRVSQAEAVGGLENYHVDGRDADAGYRCTGCHRPLVFCLGLFAEQWWSIDHPREALEKSPAQTVIPDGAFGYAHGDRDGNTGSPA